MKLKACHITGFGKMNDRSFDFTNGLNVFCEENGFGKSTLASFIKVMLYGFEDESKRSLKDKEREKYRPWNKGVYGGSIVFEYDGKEYEVSRTFGKNENDDSFEVRELPSNAVCSLFEKSSLGETIFGIDKNSFFRTAYIASRDLNKSDESITDSIRAKLGNLTDATDDINNFDTAVSRFEKKMNEYTPERKTGKIKSLQNEIADKNNRLRNLEDVEKATEILEGQIVAQTGRIDKDKLRIKELKDTEGKVMKAESNKAKKKMYDSLKEDYETSRKNTDEIFDFFAGHIPSLSDINSVRDKSSRKKNLINEMNSLKIEDGERWNKLKDRFENGTPTEDEIKNYISLWNEMQSKKKETDDKEENLKEEAEKYIENKKAECSENYERGLEAFRTAEKKRKTKLAIFVILAVISFGAAIALTVMGMMGKRADFILIPEVASFVIGVIFVILIFALRLLKKGEFNLSRDVDITVEEAISKVDSSNFTRNVIKSQRGEIEFTNNQVKNFFEKYKASFREDKVVDELVVMLEDVKEYGALKSRNSKLESDRLEYEQLSGEIKEFFDRIGKSGDEENDEQLDEYQRKSVRFVSCMEESERKKNNLVQFESENDITDICTEYPEDLPDIGDLRDEVAELEEEIEKETEALSNFRNRLEERQEERDELILLKVRLEEDKERLAKYEKDYDLMSKTLEFLSRAKNELSLKYTGPTMDGFKKYCSFFDEEDSESFRIDTDLNLTKTEEGMQRRISDLSLGLREVTDFCLRLALIDAMYQKEKPFVILDDPFSDYDKSNLSGAMKVLEDISKDYQIIYFTCHESRTVNDNPYRMI
ncbi:MAG: AAA family ATPase [Lachnospiraceae bacterium]|nr:AAA family ATPase [Lachnospiraceae bacterium]